MPKVTIYPQQRIWEFPEGGFQVFEDKLWCPFCQEFVDFMKKCVIKAHVVSKKHSKCRAMADKLTKNQSKKSRRKKNVQEGQGELDFGIQSLINSVKKNKCLWDKRMKKNRNKLLVHATWGDVAKEIGKTIDQTKEMWENLLVLFHVLYNDASRGMKTALGLANAINDVEWPYFTSMLFLKYYISKEEVGDVSTLDSEIDEEVSDLTSELSSEDIHAEMFDVNGDIGLRDSSPSQPLIDIADTPPPTTSNASPPRTRAYSARNQLKSSDSREGYTPPLSRDHEVSRRVQQSDELITAILRISKKLKTNKKPEYHLDRFGYYIVDLIREIPVEKQRQCMRTVNEVIEAYIDENYHGLGLMHRQGDSSFNGALEAHLQFIKEKMKARRPRAPNSVRANGNVNDHHTAATMIEAFVNVGIPPRVLGNEKFRTWIKGNLKYSGNLPSPRRLLEVAGPADILETVTECLDKDVCLLLVETAGVVGSGKAVHVLVAPLGNRARFRLLASKVIVPGNSDAALELVLSTMDVAGIKRWNVVALVSTNADYLQVAGRQLQSQCRRLHLMTCWNQILRSAMNEVRNRCSVLDQYVQTIECVLDQAPKLQDDLLHALQTSRRFQCAASTNWLKTVNFHAEHIDQELDWIASMEGDGCTLLRLKVLASQPELREQLARIQKIYPGLLKAVEIVDNGELTISSAFWTMHAVVGLLDSAGFPVNELRTQLDMALPSPRFWRIVEMLDPQRVALPEVLQTDCLKELERFDEAPVPPDEISLYVKTLMANQDRGASQVPAIQFWNAYSRIMPTLSRLAVKVLSLPVTTSYVENRFDVVARSLSATCDERESLAVELRVLFNSKYRESDVN